MSINPGEISFAKSSFVDVEVLIKEARQRQRRRWKLFAGLGVTLVMLATGLFLTIGGGPAHTRNVPNPSHGPRSVPSVAPLTHGLTTTLSIAGFHGIAPLKNVDVVASGAGSFWVLSQVSKVVDVVRISASTDRVINKIPVNGAWDVAYGDGAVWVASGDIFGNAYYLIEISPKTDRVVHTTTIKTSSAIYASGAIAAITVTHHTVYLVERCVIYKVDAGSARLLATWKISSCRSPISLLSVANGLLWFGGGGSLRALNSVTGAVEASAALPNGFGVQSITIADGNLWAAGAISREPGSVSGALVELNASNGALKKTLNDGALAVASDSNVLWTAYAAAKPQSTVPAPSSADNAVGSGDIAVSEIAATTGRTISRFAEPAIGGGTFFLAIASTKNEVAVMDEGPTLFLSRIK